jgi:hypothetical protein
MLLKPTGQSDYQSNANRSYLENIYSHIFLMFDDQLTRFAPNLRLQETYFILFCKPPVFPFNLLFYLITTYMYYYSFCCEDNVTFCLHNVPKCFILLRKSQKIFWGEAQPLSRPLPTPRPPRRLRRLDLAHQTQLLDPPLSKLNTKRLYVCQNPVENVAATSSI